MLPSLGQPCLACTQAFYKVGLCYKFIESFLTLSFVQIFGSFFLFFIWLVTSYCMCMLLFMIAISQQNKIALQVGAIVARLPYVWGPASCTHYWMPCKFVAPPSGSPIAPMQICLYHVEPTSIFATPFLLYLPYWALATTYARPIYTLLCKISYTFLFQKCVSSLQCVHPMEACKNGYKPFSTSNNALRAIF